MTHAPTPLTADNAPQELATPFARMEWLLDEFVSRVGGVTHALLVSKDGLLLLGSSLMGRDWADTLAATVSGHASLAHGTLGPKGDTLPASQIIIERADCLFFIMVAGKGLKSAFSPTPERHQGSVEAVLGVLAEPDADAGLVGFEMGQLVKQFAHLMQTPVRQEPYGASSASTHTGNL